MNSTVIAVDLAKDVYEVAIANHAGKILERLRLNRTQFQNLLVKREPATVIFEACGTAHHWGRLGKISKRGDCYLRMLLTHGARSVLARAKQLKLKGDSMTPLQQWATQLEQRVGHNKATCAIANKLARICWAVWTTESSFHYAVES